MTTNAAGDDQGTSLAMIKPSPLVRCVSPNSPSYGYFFDDSSAASQEP